MNHEDRVGFQSIAGLPGNQQLKKKSSFAKKMQMFLNQALEACQQQRRRRMTGKPLLFGKNLERAEKTIKAGEPNKIIPQDWPHIPRYILIPKSCGENEVKGVWCPSIKRQSGCVEISLTPIRT